MANFRTTADYVDKILDLSGEITNGNSAYEATALYYLNRVHNSLLSGGTDILPEVDELWPWAMAKEPINLVLQPKYNTGTIGIDGTSTVITFTDAPTTSLEGWHVKVDADDTVYRIMNHDAGASTGTLDSPSIPGTVTGKTFEAFKLEYELIPEKITISDRNYLILFSETTANTNIAASLAHGVYTPAELVVEIKTKMDAAGASTYTPSYRATERKFSISSDRSGGDNVFRLLGASVSSDVFNYESALPTLGFGFKDHADASGHKAERALGAISKLSQPIYLHNNVNGMTEVNGIDLGRFTTDYPLSDISSGTPTRFTVVEERDDGYMRIRLNKHPKDAMRMDVHYVPQPLDLYDVATSAPLVPRKWSQILTHGAAAYLAMEKNDDRSQSYIALAQNQLKAMQKSYRKDERRVGKHYGQVIAREDMVSSKRRRLLYGYEHD